MTRILFLLPKSSFDKLKENSPKFALKLQSIILEEFVKSTNKIDKFL